MREKEREKEKKKKKERKKEKQRNKVRLSERCTKGGGAKEVRPIKEAASRRGRGVTE